MLSILSILFGNLALSPEEVMGVSTWGDVGLAADQLCDAARFRASN
jgi:hypothetical protein